MKSQLYVKLGIKNPNFEIKKFKFCFRQNRETKSACNFLVVLSVHLVPKGLLVRVNIFHFYLFKKNVCIQTKK